MDNNLYYNTYAEMFLYFLTELKNKDGESHKIIKKAFTRAVRDWSDNKPQFISKVVAGHFKINHPTINPFVVNHRPRNKYGLDLILEHTTPVNNIVKSLMSVNPTIDEVKQVMSTHTGMAIITRDEDDHLKKMGYTTNRPNGWMNTYNECNIEVITEEEYTINSFGSWSSVITTEFTS
jgi:hypothetical protein